MATADCWLPGQTLNMHRIPLETSEHQNHLTMGGQANRREKESEQQTFMCVSVRMSDRWKYGESLSVYANFVMPLNEQRDALVLPN